VQKLNERFGFDLPLDIPAESLTISQGQKAAIISMLLRNVTYLIFDEPTSVLTPGETQNLFELFQTLREQGKGIVLISHKLDETINIADRITVIRQGKTQVCCAKGELSNDDLYSRIFGKAFITERVNFSSSGATDNKNKQPVLSLRNFAVNVHGRPILQNINLELHRGKIQGVVGVRDSGLETLELALAGFLPWTGTLCVNGTELAAVPNTAQRINAFRTNGINYLGSKHEGASLSIKDMLIIHSHRRFQKRGVLNQRGINEWIKNIMAEAGISSHGGGNANISGNSFSGGQLQRLLLAREMAEQGALMILSEPCRGLDSQYRQSVSALLRKKPQRGRPC
jgi:simple sugar transport system ATP-binding protein